MLAKLEEEHGFHTIRREVMKPHKPLVGVEFDPSWNKKIGPVEKTAKPAQQDDDSPAEEVESEKEEGKIGPVDDPSSSYSSVDEDSWESEYDVSSDFESDTPSEPGEEVESSVQPGMSKTKLCSDVSIEYPDKYNFGEIQAMPWSQERRANEIKDIDLKYMEKLCSDIYLMVDKSRNKTILVFDQSDEALVTVSVQISDDEDSAYIYEARIRNRSHWVRRAAEHTGDQIKFHATEIESFFIVKIPLKESAMISPQGNTLSFKHTKGVSLDIPSHTVNKPQPIVMQLNEVDKHAIKYRHSLYPEKFNIKKMSQRLFIEHDIPEFHNPFSVELELETFRESADNDALVPVAFHWKEGEPTIKSKAEYGLHQKANKVVMTMKTFLNKSGVSVGLVAHGKINPEEAKLVYADMFLCKLVIHIKLVKSQEAMVYINCVLIENLPKIQEHYQSLYMIGESENIYLKNFQRIRVHLSGNSVRRKSKTQRVLNCFIVFSDQAKQNCLSFPVDKDTRMGSSPSTTFDFSLDSGSKKKIHRQEFDPWMLVGMKTCSTGNISALKRSRGQTSVDFKSKRQL
ncbi:uncharacterized protein LOC125646621 [Ostrea edulis]|uniref:uncharacterized protein LOC125646621 n=1 Tax=Ostrea edulis TaxID=37623 RepID=UPI0024AEC329|nr:uncharacterized protein LOC125646621 [Ostrea edulis]